MFPGIPQKLRGSFSDTQDPEGMAARLEELERTMSRVEVLLVRMLPSQELPREEEEEDELGEGSTLRGDGFTAESSFRGQGP